MIRFAAVGAVVGAVVGLLIHQIERGAVLPHAIRGSSAGVIIGVLVGAGEELAFAGRLRWRNYRSVTSLRVALYTVVVLLTLVLINGVSLAVTSDQGLTNAMGSYVGGETMARDLVLATVVAVLGTAFLEVRHLHNPGDLRSFLLGRYRFPVQESRVFLFADLADSTSIAERLGDLRYSRFLGDCYRDVAEAILAWRGQVYQYVGDEVVISWPLAEGSADAACIECFFAMTDLLESSRARYEEIYGVTPLFRAGLHGGAVVVTWVGLAKTELAFLGDALNAASRMQGVCKELGESCVVSGTLMESLTLPADYRARSLGMVALRGKSDAMELFAIDRSVVEA